MLLFYIEFAIKQGPGKNGNVALFLFLINHYRQSLGKALAS